MIFVKQELTSRGKDHIINAAQTFEKMICKKIYSQKTNEYYTAQCFKYQLNEILIAKYLEENFSFLKDKLFS